MCSGTVLNEVLHRPCIQLLRQALSSSSPAPPPHQPWNPFSDFFRTPLDGGFPRVSGTAQRPRAHRPPGPLRSEGTDLRSKSPSWLRKPSSAPQLRWDAPESLLQMGHCSRGLPHVVCPGGIPGAPHIWPWAERASVAQEQSWRVRPEAALHGPGGSAAGCLPAGSPVPKTSAQLSPHGWDMLTCSAGLLMHGPRGVMCMCVRTHTQCEPLKE